MPECITVTISPIQNLAAMHRSLRAQDKQIAQMEIDMGITAMKQRRSEIAAEYEVELARIAPTLEYAEDKFLRAMKKRGESYREGNVKIMRTSRTIRNVLTEKFCGHIPGPACPRYARSS